MKAIHLLAASAILLTSQAFALGDAKTQHGCPPEVSDCANDGNSGGGFGPSSFMGSFSDGKGGSVDFYDDAGGEWWVENHADGTSQVGWDESAGPQMLKKFPKQPGAKRPSYTKAQMTAAAAKSFAAAQQKATADKAAADKAAADKAAAAKAAADKAAAVYNQAPISTHPGLAVSTLPTRKKP